MTAVLEKTKPIATVDFVTVEGRALKAAMKYMSTIVERRATMPILSTVLLKATPSVLTIVGTDLEQQITTRLGVADIAGTWSICINARVLADIAAQAGAMNVRIQYSKGNSDAFITVGDDVATYTVSTFPADDFPDHPVTRGDLLEEFKDGEFAAMMDKVRDAISTEETRYYLNGVCWHFGAHGRAFVATDGHRLSMCSYDDKAEAEDVKRIIARRTVAIVSKHLAGKPVKVFAARNNLGIVIVAPSVEITAKLVDGTYPDYRRVMPGDNSLRHTFKFQRPDLMAAIDMAGAISTAERFRGVKISPEKGRVTISGSSADFGSSSARTSAEWPASKPEAFGFNRKYLREIVARCKGEIVMRMAEAGSPFVFLDAADATMTRVLMPMRV